MIVSIIFETVYNLPKIRTMTPRWMDSSTGSMFSGATTLVGEVGEGIDGTMTQSSLLTV